MTPEQIRQSFIDFFKSRAHTEVPSASLMPDAANLLFTNSGMNQFIPYFLGDQHPPYPSAVDTQKCIRAGGKHNDLDDVGFDTYHHTFFEMLGNWSFGDYFKAEAIAWSWELLTQVWGFPKERLYVTVYKPSQGDPADFDQEAYDFWKAILEKEGLDPAKHIVYGNKKDNFWMMGDTGPCGPCSEVHIDLTPAGDTAGKLVNADSPYCIEIWNLVFIQFNALPDGSFKPLAQKHVDTGMGFERVAGILATTKNFTDFSQAPSNYNSQLFTKIFEKITALSGHKYDYTLPTDRHNMSEAELKDCAFRVLADHIRTLSFAIADGILPGNEGRNYVLRRILRRAVLFGKHLELPHGFFAQLIDPVLELMANAFPELRKQEATIRKVIANEEKAFERTLDRGLQLLDKVTQENNGHISGEDAFTLYDTYGFPIDLTQLIAEERKLTLDLDGFNTAMEAQKQRARASQKKTVITVSEDTSNEAKTLFVGFDRTQEQNLETQIDRIVHDPEGHSYIVTPKTPFYAEKGGQLGDQGTAEINGKTHRITDTVNDPNGHVLHRIEGKLDTALEGQSVTLSVDTERRRAIERHHTATHLLHWALRKILGSHVKQAGSLVAPGHLRFDFAHFEAMTPEQIDQVERLVNTCVLQNDAVTTYEVPFSEKPDNCIAFFGEKYGKTVRVVDIADYSVELCGGAHVAALGEIGLFKIKHESAIAAGTRRIEALTGMEAYNWANTQLTQFSHIAQKLGCKPEKLEKRLEQLIEQKDAAEKKVRSIEQAQASGQVDQLVAKAQVIDGIAWVQAYVEASNPNDLRSIAVQIAKHFDDSVVLLGAAFGDKGSAVALCSEGAIKQGTKAGELISTLAQSLGGKGGGKPDFAMGGFPANKRTQNALEKLLTRT